MVFPALALVIVFAAFLIRVYRLDAIGLEGDEAFAIETASKGFAQIVRLVAEAEPHPPLYYSALRVWYLLAGTSEFALRYPSLIANVLAVGALTRLAAHFSWRTAGLVGAALLALNPYQVWYAQEARMYAPLAVFGLLAVDRAIRSLSPENWRHIGLYALFMLLSLYTHYYGIFLFAFTAAFGLAAIWWHRRPPPTAARWIGAQIFVVALFLPWLVIASRIALSYAPFARGSVDLVAVLEESLARHSVGHSVPFETGLMLSFGFLAVAACGAWLAGRDGDCGPGWLRRTLVCGYWLAPVALGLLVSLFRPMLAARYLMVSAPAFFLAMGLGVAGLYRRAALLGVVVGLLLASAEVYSLVNYFSDDRFAKSDFREAAAYIRDHARPGDGIVLDGWSQKFQLWYYYTLQTTDPAPSYLFPPEGGEGWPVGLDRLDEVMARHQGVWLLDYDVLAYDPQRVVETHLARSYYQVLTHRIGQNRVAYYASAPVGMPEPMPLSVSCNQEILLEELSRGRTTARPGEVMQLVLRWRALKAVDRDYVVSWRLLDAVGHLALQRDSPPASGFAPTRGWTPGQQVSDRFGLALPSVLMPGRYVLAILVYDRETGARCEAEQGGRTLPGGLIPLGSIEVSDGLPVAGLAELTPQHEARLAWDGLRLLGFNLGGGPFRPGDTIQLRLLWEAGEDSGRDRELAARLTAEDGTTVLDQRAGLGPTQYPASRWPRGRRVATYLDLVVPARASTGSYRLLLAVEPTDRSGFAPLTTVSIVSRARSFEVPPIAHPRRIDFGGLIELLGFDQDPAPGETIGAGQTLHLNLYWRALGEVATSYKVFTQLLGPDGKIYGQEDAIPLAGKAPTSGWAPGEVFVDPYSLVLRPQAPAGPYRLIVGLYEPETGRRIPLADGSGDHFVVGTLRRSDQ